MNLRRIWLKLDHASRRRQAAWFVRRPFTLPPGRALVSFCFDDFPRSALFVAGEILERHGLRGTYYVSLGLAGKTCPSGEIFQTDDLPQLAARGHELGCHTFDHCPAWTTPPAEFEASIVRNAAALRTFLPLASFDTLSYPIEQPRPATKRRAARHFPCVRGGGQTFNRGTFDRNYMAAYFIEKGRAHPESIRRCIDANARAGGWLILATHDVDPQPTPFGCTPQLFEGIVKHAVESGAEILPVHQAWQEILSRRGQARP